MTARTDLIVSLLKHTKSSPAAKKIIARETTVSLQVVNNVINRLCEIGLVECENELIELSSNQRVKLAIYAINKGTDVERVCKVLDWKEFENFAATAFEKNNFVVKRNFRFKTTQRRWEIDVLAYSEPVIVSVDCKRWRRGWDNSAITRVAVAQAERTEELANNIQYIRRKIGLDNWKRATFLPMVLSLFPGSVKFYKRVPVVPISQLQNFIDEFQGHITEMAHFRVTLKPNLSDYS